MTIATLQEFKGFIRELSDDLDATLQLALTAASAECVRYLGAGPGEAATPDVVVACCLLAQTYADAGTAEDNHHRREAAYRLMHPHRLGSGLSGA